MSKKGQFDLMSDFIGYRNKEDVTTLKPNILVSGSKNVLIGAAGRIAPVKGYTVDGASSSVIDSGIRSNFDFNTFNSDVRNMRAGFLTNTGNDGKLQYRYSGTWYDLKTSLTSVSMSFAEFWDTTELKKLLLWVDGSNTIQEWNGAVTTILSNTGITLTKSGTKTWTQEGFFSTRDKSITINGIAYTYTGGENTTTLTGLVALPTFTVGAVVHQTPISTNLSAMTSILATLSPTVIGVGRANQAYIGSSSSNSLYISKVNNYKDYGFTLPVRLVGEGNLLQLQAPPVAFISQQEQNFSNITDLYVATGKDSWYYLRSALSDDLTKERQELVQLKTAQLQGAKSERLVGKMKNVIIFISNGKELNTLGYIQDNYVPTMDDISRPIVNDMISYDFTDSSVYYFGDFIFIAIPKHGIIRMYNMTNELPGGNVNQQSQQWFWEAPISYPLSGFYVVDGVLYGHGYNTSESYKLFTGGSFAGQDIESQAVFAFNAKGDRTTPKGGNELWAEGYIQQNTNITATIQGDLDANATSQTVTIEGANSQYVAFGSSGGAIGKDHIGSKPIGGDNTSIATVPAYFHVVKTYEQIAFYLEKLSFYSKGIDLYWELITFGTNATISTEGNNHITD